jgi:hypothetical protein
VSLSDPADAGQAATGRAAGELTADEQREWAVKLRIAAAASEGVDPEQARRILRDLAPLETDPRPTVDQNRQRWWLVAQLAGRAEWFDDTFDEHLEADYVTWLDHDGGGRGQGQSRKVHLRLERALDKRPDRRELAERTWRGRGLLVGLQGTPLDELLQRAIPSPSYHQVVSACARARLSGMPADLVVEHERAWHAIRQQSVDVLLAQQQEQFTQTVRPRQPLIDIDYAIEVAADILVGEALTGLYPSLRAIQDNRLRPPGEGRFGSRERHSVEDRAEVAPETVERHDDQGLRLLGRALDTVLDEIATGRWTPDGDVFQINPEELRGVGEAVRVWYWYLPELVDSARVRDERKIPEGKPQAPIGSGRSTALRAESPEHLRDALREAMELAVPALYAYRQGRPLRKHQSVAALIARRAATLAEGDLDGYSDNAAATVHSYQLWTLLLELETLAEYVNYCESQSRSPERTLGAVIYLTDVVGEFVTLLTPDDGRDGGQARRSAASGVLRWGNKIIGRLGKAVQTTRKHVDDPDWADVVVALQGRVDDVQAWVTSRSRAQTGRGEES